MIANISPDEQNYEDTWNTLTYANRAKNIKANVTKSTVNINASVAHYRDVAEKQKEELQTLKKEIDRLKEQLSQKDKRIEDLESENFELSSQLEADPKNESKLKIFQKFDLVERKMSIVFKNLFYFKQHYQNSISNQTSTNQQYHLCTKTT